MGPTLLFPQVSTIRVITKLPNSEQSSKAKVNCENHNDPDLVQAFLEKWWVESDFKAPNLPLSLRPKVPAVNANPRFLVEFVLIDL